MYHFSHSNQSYANNSQHHHSLAIKSLSLIPEIVMVMALAWFSFDLAFRFGGYQEAYWMIDLDMVAVLVLIVAVGVLALRHHVQSAEHTANEYQRHKQTPFHVYDGGMSQSAQNSKPDKQRPQKPSAYFDGGTFPAPKRRKMK